jgi:hypothetical protein
VIYHKDSRVYFDKPFDESNGEPPTCYSDDAITGYMLEGDPEEGKRRACSCATCPFAEWDSAEKGKGQACSMNKNFFMITKDSVFPIHVRIPAGSYKVAQKDFLVSVTKSLVPYYGVIAKFGLVEEKNPQGIKYAKLKVEEKRKLDPADAATFKAFHEQFKPMLSQVRAESASFTTDGDGVTFGEGQEVGGGLDLD